MSSEPHQHRMMGGRVAGSSEFKAFESFKPSIMLFVHKRWRYS